MASKDLLKLINTNIIGKDAVFQGPFGVRNVLYCDYTASGKPLRIIEDYIQDHVLPMYANTHTTTCATALQTSYFRQEARDIIRNSVRASEHDAVIFTANGVTGAVHKLVNGLHLKSAPVVFLGPYEHHSNMLLWREISENVVRISETSTGINLEHLEAALRSWSITGLPMIGCFTAASNITGQICDRTSISVLLHKYGALSFWDFATAAPYVDIDMHPYVESGDASKDAIFISPHKFVGGVSTPGVLVVRKDLLANPTPSDFGGGSVFFVSEKTHTFLQDRELREEGGTPDIVGSVRCGLSFKLKNDVGSDVIMSIENGVYKKVTRAWTQSDNIELLGSNQSDCDRLAIFSFMIRHSESGLYLHYSFVAALLNDLFGIQARGGCMCAGPFAQDLLGIPSELVEKYRLALTEDARLDRRHLRRFREFSKYEVLRPGFVRLSLPYFFNREQIDFVIEAVLLIADIGWMILPQYTFDPDTGEWRHVRQKLSTNRKWLGRCTFGADMITQQQQSGVSMTNCLEEARQTCEKAKSHSQSPYHEDLFDSLARELRWFLTPFEAHSYMIDSKPKAFVPPFRVRNSIETLSKEDIQLSVAVPSSLLEMLRSKSRTTQKKVDLKSSPPKSELVTVQSPVSELIPVKTSFDLNKTTLIRAGFVSPPKILMKLTKLAIEDFKMIENGDRVLVCLSGGKDSLSLLHVMRQYQFIARKDGIHFELGAVTIDPKSSSYDPKPLKPYLASLGLPYFYEEQGILNHALSLPELTSICAFCSRMKRGRLYHCARREGWNILAMGQHLDDLAESFLMSTFQNGLLRTMKANYTVKEKDLRVIRPFSYVREKDTRDFAERSHLPIIPENCPACFEAPKERHRMKQLLASLEVVNPKLFYSIKEAIKPLMAAGKNESIDNCDDL